METARYDPVAVALHWLIALLILLMLALGMVMGDLPESIKFPAYGVHKATGILIIGLSVFRLVWRLLNPPPKLLDAMPRGQKLLAHVAHWALYGLMFAMPLSGWLMVSVMQKYPIGFFGLGEVPFLPLPAMEDPKAAKEWLEEVHEMFANGALVLFAVHVGAALHHHFIMRDGTLLRMAPRCLHRLLQKKPRAHI